MSTAQTNDHATTDPLDFTGSVVLVTGGSRGIGRGITEAFLSHGAAVVICGRSEPEQLPEARGRTARFVAADVRDAAAVDALISDIEASEGHLDVVIITRAGPHRWTPPRSALGFTRRSSPSTSPLRFTWPSGPTA